MESRSSKEVKNIYIMGATANNKISGLFRKKEEGGFFQTEPTEREALIFKDQNKEYYANFHTSPNKESDGVCYMPPSEEDRKRLTRIQQKNPNVVMIEINENTTKDEFITDYKKLYNSENLKKMDSYQEVLQNDLFWNQIYPKSDAALHSIRRTINSAVKNGDGNKWFDCRELAKGKGGVFFGLGNPEANTIYSRIQEDEILNNEDKAWFAERYFTLWKQLYNSKEHSPEKVQELYDIAIKLCTPAQKTSMENQAKKIMESSQKAKPKSVSTSTTSTTSTTSSIFPSVDKSKEGQKGVELKPMSELKDSESPKLGRK